MQAGLLQEIANYVREIFNTNSTDKLLYHDFAHTCAVVNRASEIAHHYKLNNEDYFVLLSAAWFHDVGFLWGARLNHEERGVASMKDFFKNKRVPKYLVCKIAQCILVTKMPSSPQTLLEQIICDADTYHFGTPDFLKTNELVKRELELHSNSNKRSWKEETLQLLRSHTFFTDYCKKILTDGKKNNIQFIQTSI
ncbi:MAG: phosphohydrolase [Flavipsychrobacter sp.]|nr:phosphohydrolase [Flavipsychrobacter sp.]